MSELVQIKNLFKIEKGSLQSTKCVEGQYTFITASSDWKTHNEYTHNTEAIIVAVAASGSLGRAHYINDKFISSDLCFILTPKNSKRYPIDLSFYFYIFKSLRDDLVKSTATGTSKLAINKTNFGNYKLPYFEISLQRRLKKRLVSLSERRDVLIDESISQHKLLKKLHDKVLFEAISGSLTKEWRRKKLNIENAEILLNKIFLEKEKLTKEKRIRKEEKSEDIKKDEVPFQLPQGWKWCRLGDVGLFERGKSKHRPRNDESLFKNGIYPFVQTGDVARSKDNNFLINTFDKKYNEKGLKQSRLWKKGTLCITIAANIAETGFLNMDACFPDSVVGFTSLTSTNLSRYVKLYIDATKQDIQRYAPATAQKNINLGIINTLVFPLPPEEEQIEIVRKTEEILKKIDMLEKKVTKNSEILSLVTKTLLHESIHI